MPILPNEMRTTPPGDSPTLLKLGGSLLLISFSTVLFTLAVWKLLAFFIMPSLFFDLLFVGFPIGAMVGVRYFSVSLKAFLRTLWILQGAMLLSVALCLVCKHADYLRAHLFDVQLVKLLIQMGTFTVLFIPFFCAYGLSEYVGYQVGTTIAGGKMRLVYATYLFGAALAYLTLQPGLRILGLTGALAVAVLANIGATAILARRRLEQGFLCASLAAVLFLFLVWPRAAALEAGFLALYKGDSMHSTRAYEREGQYVLRFQEWGKYSLTEIMSTTDRRDLVGFYNDFMQWEFTQNTGFSSRMLGAVPINITPPGGRLAIIGAGGGRQVRWALQPNFDFEDILALELEPAVFKAVLGDLREDFGSVYQSPRVRPVNREARGYMESTQETFDLIFLPSVGGYPQMMLEPGNMIRTADAYRTLKNRLSDRGILAIWYPSGLDPVEILTRQYTRTLGEQGLGLKTRVYRNVDECLILAAKDPNTVLPSPADIDAFLTAPTHSSGLPPRTDAAARTLPVFVLQDPLYKPITDEQPYLAGNVRHIFSLGQLYSLFGIATSFLVLACVVTWIALRRRGDPKIPGKSYAQVAGLSLLIGANFIVFEHFVILGLFKKMYVFHDALSLGAISFLILSGLGSVLVTQRTRAPIQAFAFLCLVAALVFERSLPSWGLLLLVLPVAYATGSFFPAIFELATRNPLAVFAMDAFGAALGSALSFFIPIAFGFATFFPFSAVLFAVTAVWTWHFCRHSQEPEPADTAIAKELSVR